LRLKLFAKVNGKDVLYGGGVLSGGDETDLVVSISVWNVYCFTPSELYLTRKKSLSPELMLPMLVLSWFHLWLFY